ncbi:ScpA family protein [Phycisphaerales bacterium AB-hyl4]|uniref:Segregation and condensation protein A n=1 Tax=Natronomicrosphaera hydrolytica TaxID=3242702 RepID=A0ABV4U8D1_9BACT
MSEYRVQLEAYAGPLDLLLYLVKRHEIDLHDIPVAKLAEQYLDHLKLIELMDMDQAGEFLVMAATLLEIKSQMLMPREQADEGEQAGEGDAQPERDPRFELVQQLLAYKRYKDASRALERQQESWSQRFAIHPVKAQTAEKAEGEAEPIELDLDDVNVMDLCQAFSRMLDSIGHQGDHQVTVDDTPISLHAADIYDRLQREGGMTLQAIFVGRTNRSEMIGLFLATLELVRENKVRVLQEDAGGEIRLEPRTEDEQAKLTLVHDEATDWRDPETGQMQYDWPDEQAKLRAERRERLRAKRAAGEAVDEADEAEYGEELEEPGEPREPGEADEPEEEMLLDDDEDGEEEEFLEDDDEQEGGKPTP